MTTKTEDDVFALYPDEWVADTGATNPQIEERDLEIVISASGATPEILKEEFTPVAAFVVDAPTEWKLPRKNIYFARCLTGVSRWRLVCSPPRFEGSEDYLGEIDETAATMHPWPKLWQQPGRLVSEVSSSLQEDDLLSWDLTFRSPPPLSTRTISVTVRHRGKREAPSIQDFDDD